MALTLTMSLIDATIVANRPATFQVNITNTSASSVTLNSLDVSEATESDCTIGQPNFMTPQVALGVGNPSIGASSTVSYTFKASFQSPATPGPSPNPGYGGSPVGGPAGSFVGQPADSVFILRATAVASDGSVGSVTMQAVVLTSLAPFPPVATGTLQLQFQPGFNLIGGLVLGLL